MLLLLVKENTMNYIVFQIVFKNVKNVFYQIVEKRFDEVKAEIPLPKFRYINYSSSGIVERTIPTVVTKSKVSPNKKKPETSKTKSKASPEKSPEKKSAGPELQVVTVFSFHEIIFWHEQSEPKEQVLEKITIEAEEKLAKRLSNIVIFPFQHINSFIAWRKAWTSSVKNTSKLGEKNGCFNTKIRSKIKPNWEQSDFSGRRH